MAAFSENQVTDELIDNVVHASFVVIALVSRVGAEHDLSLTQMRVLAILRDYQPTMAQLAAHLGLERSSVSGLIDRAVGRDLAQRNQSDEDGRVVRITLTPAGEHLATLLVEKIGSLIAPMTGKLGPSEQKRLATLLDKVLE